MSARRQWASSSVTQAWRRWLAGEIGPDGEQMPLPGMPPPPTSVGLRLLPFLLRDVADKDGQLSPGRAYLARVTGTSERAVQGWVNDLVRAGWLAVVSPGRRGRRAVWMLTIPAWATPDRENGGSPYRGRKGEPPRMNRENPRSPLQGKNKGSVEHRLPQTPSPQQDDRPAPEWAQAPEPAAVF